MCPPLLGRRRRYDGTANDATDVALRARTRAVRDPRVCARHLPEAIESFGGTAEMEPFGHGDKAAEPFERIPERDDGPVAVAAESGRAVVARDAAGAVHLVPAGA
ncbi:hypothetical protein GCM10023085_24970 [Actinomadura viridis]